MYISYLKTGSTHKLVIRDEVGRVFGKSKIFKTQAEVHKFQTLLNNANYSDPSKWIHRSKKYKGVIYWILYCHIDGAGRCFGTNRLLNLPPNADFSDVVDYKNIFCTQLPTIISAF